METRVSSPARRVASPSRRVPYLSLSAATPGRVLPSRNSRLAPPPVLMWLNWPARPLWLTALTLSPPPTMLRHLVAAMAFRDGHRAGGEGLHLEAAHGAVPHHGLRLRDLGGEALALSGRCRGPSSRPGCRPRPRSSRRRRRRTCRRRRGPRAGGSGRSSPSPSGGGPSRGRPCPPRRGTCRWGCPSRVEGVGHRPADDEAVHLPEEVLDDGDLVAHLGPAQDRDERPLGALQGPAEVVDLLLHEQARCVVLEEPADDRGGGVRRGARCRRRR